VTSPKIQFLALPSKYGVSLSPDAQHITYISDDRQTLYIADADGANPQPVELPSANSIQWSPNGQRLLVTNGKSLYAVSLSDHVPIALNTSNAVPGQPDTSSTAAVWSPDNEHVALWTPGDLETVRVLSVLDTLKPAQVVHVMLPATRNTVYSKPVWVPGGQRLIVRVSDGKNNRLLVIDGLSGVQEASLTLSQAFDTSPFWVSPMGQWVIFIVAGTGSDKDGFYVMKTDGGALKYIMKNPAGTAGSVDWSPDGQRAFIDIPAGYGTDDDFQWWEMTDMSLHTALKGQHGIVARLWAPDSQSMLICQVTQSERHTPTVGKLWRVFVAAGSTPVVLFNTPICPSYWLP